MQENFKYIGFVGCFTKEGQADPFEASHGGAPHDRSKVGRGVLAIGVDATGKISALNHGEPIITAEELPNPSYLCILEPVNERNGNSRGSLNRPTALRDGGLCIVSELQEGKVQSFAVKIEKNQQGVIEIHTTALGEALDTGGSWPCYIISTNVGDEMECIIVCNYGEKEGVVSIFGCHEGAQTDMFSKQTSIFFGPGSKVDRDRQDVSHAHSATVVPSSSRTSSSIEICCADLGSDAIAQFSLTTVRTNATKDGLGVSLQCTKNDEIAAPPGSGPRSLMFNPVFTDIAVVSLEMTAQIWLIQRNPASGIFKALGNPVSILPEHWPKETESEYQFNRGRWASDAVWSPCGKFLYAAARLHNSISVFEVQLLTAHTMSIPMSNSGNVDGLMLVQRVSTSGLAPRCLCMSECGQFVLVAHQHSHDVSSFRRNEMDGMITFVDQIYAPNASCVKLIRPGI